MYDYTGLATYDVYREQLDKVLSTTPRYLCKIVQEDNQLYGSLITVMMLADWRFDPSKGIKQSTYRMASLKFKLRNILNHRNVLTHEELQSIADSIRPKTASKIDTIDLVELLNHPKYTILVRYIEGFSIKEICRQFKISADRVGMVLEGLAKEIVNDV